MIACREQCWRLTTVKKNHVDPSRVRTPVRGATDTACINDAEPGALKIAIYWYSLDSLGLHEIPHRHVVRSP
jgi:hypothetical protein